MKPILYSYFRSSASYRVRIALHLKEIDFDYNGVHLLKDGGQQNALNYLAVNAMGQVPTFVDGMNVIAQSMAIIQYLDDKWPEPRLFPKDISEKAMVIELCEIINSGVQPLVNLIVRQKLEKEFSATDEQSKKWCQDFMNKGMMAFEKKIAKTAGKYCFGDNITAADIFLVPNMFSATGLGVKAENFPITKKIFDTLSQIEAFKKAHPSRQPDTPMEN
jgi:maleylacetoacetate isomerase